MTDDLTGNEKILDGLVSHQTGLQYFSGGLQNKVWRKLDATESEVRSLIRERLRYDVGKPMTRARMARVERLIELLTEVRADAWEGVSETWYEELRALASSEVAFTITLAEGALGVELGAKIPTAERLNAIVRSEPFMGGTLGEWAAGAEEADIRRITQAIRIGMVQGDDIRTMASRVVGTIQMRGRDGVTQITRHNAKSITRTAVNAISSGARREFYAANADIIPELVFIATLDSRTTPICRSLDGQKFKREDAPVLPLHWGERSLLAPSFDGDAVGERPTRNFTEKQLLREFADESGFDAVTHRNKLPYGTRKDYDDFRAARIRSLTGQAPTKLSYANWLERKPAWFQDDILGPTRGALYRRGGLTLDRFVARDGREFSLAELARFDADAFRAAGLDPANFN